MRCEGSGFASVLACATLLACSSCDRSAESTPTTAMDTIGDTIRVRTMHEAAPVLTLVPEVRIGDVEGSEETQLARVGALVEGPGGGIYVWDARRTDLRLFDATGAFVRTIGRRGQGPGEYQDANGIASLSNGDVAVWDAQSARFTVFAPDGAVRTSWRWQSSMIFAPHRLPTDADGNLLVPLLIPPVNASAGTDGYRFAYVRMRPDGDVIDTLALPAEEPAPMLRAEGGGSSTGAALPFADQRASVVTPQGTIGTSYAGVYRIDIPRVNGRILRIERDIDPVAVQDAERRDLAEEITRDMRKVDPTWRWSGPDIPRVKPHIR